MANELDPLSNVVAIIDYCRTAGTSPDLDVLAELLAKVPTSHPNPDKCCPDCVREKQMAIAAMNKALDAALVKAILPNTGAAEVGALAETLNLLEALDSEDTKIVRDEEADDDSTIAVDLDENERAIVTAHALASLRTAAAEHAAEVERLKNELAAARVDGNRYLNEAIAVFEDVGNAGISSPKLALSKLLGTIDLLRSAKDSHNNSWFTVEDIASGSSFSCKHGNVKDPLVISLRSDVMRVRADLAELRQIDAALARRPALDKPTRYENIVHAITTAGDATDKANRYLSDIKAILSLLGVDVAEVNWTEPSVYATAQKAWHKVTNATVLARGERDAAQAKLLAVRQAWKDLRANMSVYETSGRHHMRGVWFKGGDAVTQVLAVEQALV